MPAEELPFPTEAQLDLVKAALLSAEHAAPAWQRWKSRGLELDTIRDTASMRLFPQLWWNRQAAGIEGVEETLLKGVYRHTIAHNAAILSNAFRATELLDNAGIPVLFFKGAALIALVDRLGLRRIDDADILVPEAYAARAGTVLSSNGYIAQPDHRPLGFNHARGYRAATGAPIDLHWWAYKSAGDDSVMFLDAERATLLGRRVLIPSATECLISAIGHAFHVWGTPRLRWISDACVLLDAAEIDWDYLLSRANRRGLTLSLAAGLDFLAAEFGAQVPASVIAELRRRPVSWAERGAYWAAVNRPLVGSMTLEQWDRYRARRLHPEPSPELPGDFLWHMATVTKSERRDVLRRAPRTALRSIALLAMRYGTGQLRPPKTWG